VLITRTNANLCIISMSEKYRDSHNREQLAEYCWSYLSVTKRQFNMPPFFKSFYGYITVINEQCTLDLS